MQTQTRTPLQLVVKAVKGERLTQLEREELAVLLTLAQLRASPRKEAVRRTQATRKASQ